MSVRTLIMATRRSPLALAQSRAFAREVEARSPEVKVSELLVVTTGDKITDVPLANVGGKGLFTKEIEEALERGEAHFAVHSFKDVPAELSPKFEIGCVPRRADARDVIVTRSGAPFADLPKGARVGTSSLRRALQLSMARPDLVTLPVRGNVDTRLRKLEGTEYDAVVLARAGLERLGLEARITETLAPELVIPAPGQGALAIECRAGDGATRGLLAPLSDPETEIAVACERGAMKTVGGNCNVPFGAYAVRLGTDIWVRVFLAEADGSRARRAERVAPWPDTAENAARIGREAGGELLQT
ncbi:MAG TPA: hydroxymethylbilane synthase [Polyangiaceae bacterium]|nr:hydroxymethylbilane synthase [Polyangiaceae bacterium]